MTRTRDIWSEERRARAGKRQKERVQEACVLGRDGACRRELVNGREAASAAHRCKLSNNPCRIRTMARLQATCTYESSGAHDAKAAPAGLRARAARTLADERGISIVFAMILLVVLLIVGGIIVSYAYSGYQRAQQDLADQKAYYNVQSAAEWVHEEFLDQRGTHTEIKGWVLEALAEAANEPRSASSATRDLTVSRITAASNNDGSTSSADAPSFDPVTVTVTKINSSNSYDIVIAHATDGELNAPEDFEGAVWHFTVSYKEERVNNQPRYILSMSSSESNLERMGQ